MIKHAWTLIGVALLAMVCLGCQTQHPKEAADLLSEVKSRGYLVVGVKYDSPPFGFLDTDQTVKGFEINLARELARRIMGNAKALKLVQINTATRVATLNARQVDFVLATMTITPEREKVVNFTTPYYKAAQGVMVKETSDIKSLSALRQLVPIAYVIGGTGEGNLKKALPEAQLLGFKSTMDGFSALQAGRAEAFSQDDVILYGFVHQYCGFRVLPERISEEPYGIAFRQEPASVSLQREVQAALDALTTEGKLERLKTRWIQSAPAKNCNSPS